MNIMKLKEIRKSKGYTLANLSNMAGCTSSYLSQLERGLKIPSLEMLRRICNCLDVPIFDLLSENETPNANIENTFKTKYNLIRHNNRKKITMPEILTEYEFITPYETDSNDQSQMVGMYTTLKPGKYSCEKLVALDIDFTIFIIQGTATAYIEEDTLTLDKGDSLYIHAGTKHNFCNTENVELIMLGFGTQHKVNIIE